MVKISVIIPVYNVEKYLKECLDSVINQTLKDIEIICVNDGSTDNSLNILENYAKKDNRIIVISQKNKGLSGARNTGLKYCSGEYVSFIDSDDYVSKDLFELTYNNAISNNSDLVIFKIARFNTEKINFNGNNYNFEEIFPDQDFNNFTFKYDEVKENVLNRLFAAWCKLYKRDFLREYDDFLFPEGLAFEDIIFNLKSFYRAKRISFVPEFLYYYRNNPTSIMNTPSYCFDIFEMIDLVEEFLLENNCYLNFYYEFNFFKYIQINQQIHSSKSEKFFQKAKEVLIDVDTSNFYKVHLNNFNLIMNSKNYDEFINKQYNNIFKQLNDNNYLLIKENDRLNKEINKYSELNKLIINSNSIKITKLFKNIKNFFKR